MILPLVAALPLAAALLLQTAPVPSASAAEPCPTTDRASGAARACAGQSFAAAGAWTDAAAAFEAAARATELARLPGAATYWAQAGNAWLAAHDATRARAALDAALAAGTLTGLDLGEAQLDRARALVAANQPGPARVDLDLALKNAAADPLAWLLSATLARRSGDLPRARTDIAAALSRAADDASVQLEAGNIAAAANDEAGARRAWTEAARLAPGRPAGRNAALALGQFGTATDTGASRGVETGR